MQDKFIRYDIKIHEPQERCETDTINGPCPYLKTGGTKFCPRHGANSRQISEKKEAARNYRLTKFRSEIREKAESTGVKSLREEIGILRLVLESILNQCNDANDLLMFSNKISDLAIKIDKLVVSCQRLEEKQDIMIDKTGILYLANTFIKIIETHIDDLDVIGNIADEISQRIIDYDSKQSLEFAS